MSGNNFEREPRNPWVVGGVLFVFWTSVFAFAGWFMKGLLTNQIHPAEFLARLPHYRDVFVHALVPTLSAVAAAAVLIGAAVVIRRLQRSWAPTAVRDSVRVWRYRRRWRATLADYGLTETEARTRRMLVPALRAVSTGPDADILTVAPLPGQSPADWDARAPRLAAALGAATGRVSGVNARGVLDLEFARTAPRGLVVTVTEPAPGLPGPAKPELVAIARGWSLRISWARIRTFGPYEQSRTRVQWGVSRQAAAVWGVLA
jgi:hypothetical protein